MTTNLNPLHEFKIPNPLDNFDIDDRAAEFDSIGEQMRKYGATVEERDAGRDMSRNSRGLAKGGAVGTALGLAGGAAYGNKLIHKWMKTKLVNKVKEIVLSSGTIEEAEERFKKEVGIGNLPRYWDILRTNEQNPNWKHDIATSINIKGLMKTATGSLGGAYVGGLVGGKIGNVGASFVDAITYCPPNSRY